MFSPPQQRLRVIIHHSKFIIKHHPPRRTPSATTRLLPYLADRKSYAKFRPMSSSLQYLTDEAGEKTAVIVPIADYTRFMEDMEDLAAIAERRKEPCINHQDFVDELKRDGLLHDNLA